jgi:NADH-quinone oxidoreductase subunit M
MLGIFAFTLQGATGGLIQMVNHGLSTGALFLLVGMIYERRHTRMIADFGGLARVLPVFTACFLIVTLSSIGLPGLNGFVGEFLVLAGTFRANIPLAVVASLGVILAAVYMLWMFQRVMFGQVTHEANRRLLDLGPRELATIVPVIVFIVWIGIYPKPFLEPTEASLKQLLTQVQARKAAEGPASRGAGEQGVLSAVAGGPEGRPLLAGAAPVAESGGSRGVGHGN